MSALAPMTAEGAFADSRYKFNMSRDAPGASSSDATSLSAKINAAVNAEVAASEGAREVIVLGPKEMARGVAMIKDMASGQEREVSLKELGGTIDG